METGVKFSQGLQTRRGEKGADIFKAVKESENVLHQVIPQMPCFTLKKDDRRMSGEGFHRTAKHVQFVSFDIHLQKRHAEGRCKLVIQSIGLTIVTVSGNRCRCGSFKGRPG